MAAGLRPMSETDHLAMTRDGVAFDARADVWSLPTPGGPVRFDFLALVGVSPSLREAARVAMRTSLAALPARTAHGDYSSLCALFRHGRTMHPGCVFEEVTPELLCDYESSLPAGSRHRAGRLAVAAEPMVGGRRRRALARPRLVAGVGADRNARRRKVRPHLLSDAGRHELGA